MNSKFRGNVGCPRSRFWVSGHRMLSFFSAASRFLIAAVILAALSISAQTTPSAPQDDSHHGQVIFSRSTDENGQTTTTVGPAAQQNAASGKSVEAPTATDAEREAVTFTDFNLDVHLRPAEHEIAIRALITVRNDGKSPLAHIPLQISSSLHWERIRIAGHDAQYTVATPNSDTDHTGQLHEAAVELATPLAPGGTLQLDVTYSGTIEQSAKRLLAIGTPEGVALHSDWDAIDTEFTGLRGFGNVAWYPVSALPVILGDGARVFDEMGEHKLRISAAHFLLHLTVEFLHGHAPTVALVNGHSVPLTIAEPEEGGDIPGVAAASFESPTIGFEAPSLFVAARTEHDAANTAIWTRPDSGISSGGEPPVVPESTKRLALATIQTWSEAAAKVAPFLQNWLGPQPRSRLTILDLPDAQDAPFETGALLVTPIRQLAADRLNSILVHALAHAWMSSPRAWLSEGVANFVGTLWIEKQTGREKALESLESGRAALALVEPTSPGESTGQPVAQAISPVYYRTKAAYIFWTLRDLAGDPALAAAFRAYDPAQDAASGLGPNADSGYFEKLFDPTLHGDIAWFFSDWLDADKGLPDIAIDNVFSTSAERPSTASSSSSSAESSAANGWLVSVDLSNSGYAAAEIPVTVRNADTEVTQRVLVPARSKATKRILLQGRPTDVQANDGTVPETEASVHVRHVIEASGDSTPSGPGTVPQ